jgi:hypothetical protein
MGKHVEEIKAQVKEHLSAEPAAEGDKEEAKEESK